MNHFDEKEIKRIMEMPDSEADEKIPAELSGIIYCLGRDAESGDEFSYAYSLLLELCRRKNARVRAQAILGLSLLAVFHRKLERKVVEPIILQEWAAAAPENKHMIQDAVDDINFALGWNLKL